MMEDNHEDLSINRQCEILSISRSRVYYEPVKRNMYLTKGYILNISILSANFPCRFLTFPSGADKIECHSEICLIISLMNVNHHEQVIHAVNITIIHKTLNW